jgi:hypothetical protein
MSGIIGKRVSLGQENGPDVDLIVSGTIDYATYETPAGFPAIYDTELGLFCYARLVDGRYESTRTPLNNAPPGDVQRHARESESVRAAKIHARRQAMNERAAGKDAIG